MKTPRTSRPVHARDVRVGDVIYDDDGRPYKITMVRRSVDDSSRYVFQGVHNETVYDMPFSQNKVLQRKRRSMRRGRKMRRMSGPILRKLPR